MDETKQIIEAALFAAGRALSLEDLARTCGSGSMGLVRKKVEELAKEYANRDSAVRITNSEEGYLMQLMQGVEKKIIHLVPETEIPTPILRTLAVIAYEQPIKQSELVNERGNKTYAYIRFLKDKGLIESQREGRTKILTVTTKFKTYFHIVDLKSLVKKEKSKTISEY